MKFLAKKGWLVFLILAFAPVFLAVGAEYPTKPITLYIPFPAGGSSDLTGRALAQAAAKHLGQPIICENKAGGGGTVGPSLLVVRPPDGYTLGISPGSWVSSISISLRIGRVIRDVRSKTTCA